MRFHDEIVYNGQINDDGVPIRANAPSSIHQGIELSAGINVVEGLTLDANASLSDNHFEEFTEYVPDWANWGDFLPIDTVDREGNTIAGFPEQLANLRLTYDHKLASVSAHVFHAGELFIDNSNEEEKRIASRTILNLRGSLKLDEAIGWAGVDLYIQVNNVFDKEYETGGYVDEEGPLFIPAAKRNFFAGLRARL
jgi:outer membrane receptor protein involved in Fe transport